MFTWLLSLILSFFTATQTPSTPPKADTTTIQAGVQDGSSPSSKPGEKTIIELDIYIL